MGESRFDLTVSGEAVAPVEDAAQLYRYDRDPIVWLGRLGPDTSPLQRRPRVRLETDTGNLVRASEILLEAGRMPARCNG